MAKNIINHIDTYNDHSRSVTINGANVNVSDLVRTFMAEDVEEVKEEAEEQVPSPSKAQLPFFIADKLQELGTYTIDEFALKYHEAVKGGAPKLAKFLKHYHELQVFDFEDRNKKEIFEDIKAFFGDELTFGYPNFAAYY